MKISALIFIICALYCSFGCGAPDNQEIKTPQHASGINWRVYDAPGFNSMYILTIDSVGYIVVSSPHGVCITPKVKTSTANEQRIYFKDLLSDMDNQLLEKQREIKRLEKLIHD